MTDQVAGTVLAERYALEDRIGVGGMATVYRAIDLTTGGRVAVKILSRELLAKNPEEADRNVKRFRREGEILRLLSGTPYVVSFVEQGVSQAGDHYIAMELLEGEQLRFYIGRGKAAMRLRTFAYYGKHLVRGLIDIHSKNLIHRDLAPDNVVIIKTREGLPWPKFLDFGIGKSVDGELDHVTQMLTIMGKPQYFSPEQARGDEPGPCSDVYSLGVVLYEMLTGHVPIEIHGMTELRRIQKEMPIPIGHYREGARVPEEVQATIMQCLEKKPEDRPTLEAVLEVVDRFSDRLDSGEEFPLPSGPPAEDSTSTLKPTVDAPTRQQTVAKGPPPPHEFAAGDTIGRFQVRERIGRGGMGLVYLAWDPILLREVAIKVASRVEEEKARRAILREARASSHLKSENIVTIYDAGTEAGTPYIAMEYVRGRTLAEIIEDGPLSGARFWRLASGILDGLIYAHEGETPVIHRDLKPANILCSGDVAKIADFGIAIGATSQHLTIGSRDQSQTGGGVEGSVLTVSPEQANNKPADHRSDIYSLGCVLYMMSTGKSPFQGNQIAILYQHVTRTPDPPSKVNPALDPPEISPVIMKCLEKDPAKRWQSVREVKAALEPMFGAAARGSRAALRARIVLVFLAALVLALLPIGLWAWNRTGSAPDHEIALAQVAGTSVRSDRPAARYVTGANEIAIELSPQTPGELRATASAEGVPPILSAVTLSRDRAVMLRIPLPDPGPRELVKYSVAIERADSPEASRKVLTVLQDVHRPRVRFEAYGKTYEPSGVPLRIVRVRDLRALVEDAGGFDDAGENVRLVLPWDKSVHDVSFTRTRKDDDAEHVWTANVDATDRAGNRAGVTQSVEMLTPDVAIRTPPEGHATREKTVRIDCTGRLPDRSRPVEGLVADDLDLGDGAFGAKLVAGPRSSTVTPMTRVEGGYSAELPIPSDFEVPEFPFEIEIHFEGEVIKRSSQRFDAKAPIITASCGGFTVSSARPDEKPRTLSVKSAGSRTEEIACRVDDGPSGVEGMTVDVRIDDKPPVRVPVDERGEFHLPRTDAEEFSVRIEATDEAGNLATAAFSVVRKGLQVTSVQLGGRERDPEGPIYVQNEVVALRLVAVGVPPADHAFARLFDETGRERQSVPLERLGGEGQIFGTPEIRLFPEGAASATRTLRILFGPDAATARMYSPELTVICDRQPPEISVTLDGGSDEIHGTRTVSRFPTLRVRIRDNVALADERAEQFLTWTRQDQGAPDVILGPAEPADGVASTESDLSFRIEPPPGPPTANVFTFNAVARDRSGRAATPRAFVIQVTPPEIAILSVAGHASIKEFGESAARPMVLSSDIVPVSVRGPRGSALPYVLVAKVYPPAGSETRREFDLFGEAASDPLEFVLQIPKAGDGRLLEAGRMAFLVQEPERKSLDELATVYYLIDRESPSWSVSRGGRLLSEAERRDWIKVSSLSDIRITVSDGRGSGLDDRSIDDPGKAVGSVDATKSQIIMRLHDDESFRDLVTREIELRVRDLAGNVTPILLKLAHSTDQIVIKSLLTAEGTDPIVQADTIVLQKPRLKFAVDSPVAGFEGVKWFVRRAGTVIASEYVAFQQGRAPEDSLIEWPPAERAEPYTIEFCADGPGGLQKEPFRTVRVLVDAAPPAIYLFAGGHPIAKGERVRIREFQDLRLEVQDGGAGLEPDSVTVEVAGPSGARARAAVSTSRDGKSFRIAPPAPGVVGVHTIVVTARDRIGNEETRQFEVEVSVASVPWTRVGPSTAPSTRSATRPETTSLRTLANDALREKDEERTGIRFRAVRAGADPNAPVRFFMSQTEVTNEQFLRFVDTLQKDQIPRELRVWNDLTLVRKRVEAMSSRFGDFRREPNLPLVAADWEVALAVAAWTGGRLPSKDEWIGAAGKYLLPAAEYPVFLDHGVPRSGEYWMRDPGFAVFQRAGMREDRRVPVTELLRSQSNAPFGIVGLAGSVAEWVTSEPGGRRVLGTMGGSFKYPYTNDVNSPRLDRPPCLSAADAGIRVVWPAQVKGP